MAGLRRWIGSRRVSPDVVMLDLVMPDMPGIEVLKNLRARGFAPPVIVLTATGGIDTVVQAMQAGAQDFFVKPACPERIMVSIRNALQMGDLKAEVDRLKKHSPAADHLRRPDRRARRPWRMVKRAGRAGGQVARSRS